MSCVLEKLLVPGKVEQLDTLLTIQGIHNMCCADRAVRLSCIGGKKCPHKQKLCGYNYSYIIEDFSMTELWQIEFDKQGLEF